MVDVPLPFLAAGRIKGGGYDDTCLARYHSPQLTDQSKRQATEDIFKKLMKATATRQDFGPGAKIRLQWQDGTVCCLRDASGSLLFCLVTTQSTYPERRAWDLLNEFASSVVKCQNYATCGEFMLEEELSPVMRQLIETYSQAGESRASMEVSTMAAQRASKFHQNQTCCQRCTNSCAVM